MYGFGDAIEYRVSRDGSSRAFRSETSVKGYLQPGDRIVVEYADGTIEPWHTEPPTWPGTGYDLIIDGPRRHA